MFDGYTSVLSSDEDGEQAELYFTNTGLLLLSVSLAASVAMNLFVSRIVLDILIAAAFGVCLFASLFVGPSHYTRPLMALRRA